MMCTTFVSIITIISSTRSPSEAPSASPHCPLLPTVVYNVYQMKFVCLFDTAPITLCFTHYTKLFSHHHHIIHPFSIRSPIAPSFPPWCIMQVASPYSMSSTHTPTKGTAHCTMHSTLLHHFISQHYIVLLFTFHLYPTWRSVLNSTLFHQIALHYKHTNMRLTTYHISLLSPVQYSTQKIAVHSTR